ncbi:unnamed protein product [Camellia sinensis]
MAVAFTVNTTAGALIKVNHSEAKDEIQELGFEYLRLGQFFCRGPVGILSGVDLHLLNMAFYAFAVALYITCRSLLSIPSPRALWAAARLILRVHQSSSSPFYWMELKNGSFPQLISSHMSSKLLLMEKNEGKTKSSSYSVL